MFKLFPKESAIIRSVERHYIRRVQELSKRSKFDEALSVLARAQAVVPQDVNAFQLSGATRQFARTWTSNHRKNKNWEKEIEALDKLMKVYPVNNQARGVWQKGLSDLEKQKDWKTASEVCKRGQKKYPDDTFFKTYLKIYEQRQANTNRSP